MKTVIIHLNCHTHPIAAAFSDVLPPSDYNIVKVINFQKETIAESLLRKCDVYIYHYLEGEHWGKYNSEYFLSKLPKKCVCICYPILRFNALWPFNTKGKFRNKFNKLVKSKLFPNGDDFLLTSFSSNVDPDVLADEYVNFDLNCVVNLDDELERIFKWFGSPRNSKDIDVSSFICENYKNKKLFHTVDHISDYLLNYMVSQLFEILSLEKNKEYTCKFMNDCNIPIHRSVIDKFDLTFIDKDSLYLYNGKYITEKQYYKEYLLELNRLGKQ